MDKINDIWKDNIQWIIENYQAGWNQVALAAEFQNATNTTIRRILKRNNIEIRGNGIDQRKVKHNPFEDLNSPKVQYWLGVFAADGCVYKNRIELGSARIEHLKQYKMFLGGKDVKILSYTHSKYTTSTCYSIKFSNTDVAEYLTNLGITAVKSHTLKINFPITWDFIRGAMDGDGCIMQCKNTKKEVVRLVIKIATASVMYKDQLVAFLTDEGMEPTVYTTKLGLYSINVCKQAKVRQMYFNMYKHAPEYFIADKYKRFGEIFGEIQR